jgi:hypothetical protein
LQALLDKSLLRRWMPPQAQPRHELDEPYFGMYLSIHEYATEKRASAVSMSSGRCSCATAAASPRSVATLRSRRWQRTAACSASRRCAGSSRTCLPPAGAP